MNMAKSTPKNIKPQLKKNLSIAEQKLKKTLMGKKLTCI